MIARHYKPGQPVLPSIRHRKHGYLVLVKAHLSGPTVIAYYAQPKE